jgi:hypothetical protein
MENASASFQVQRILVTQPKLSRVMVKCDLLVGTLSSYFISVCCAMWWPEKQHSTAIRSPVTSHTLCFGMQPKQNWLPGKVNLARGTPTGLGWRLMEKPWETSIPKCMAHCGYSGWLSCLLANIKFSTSLHGSTGFLPGRKSYQESDQNHI